MSYVEKMGKIKYELTFYDDKGDLVEGSLWSNKQKAKQYIKKINFEYHNCVLMNINNLTEV